MPVPAKSAPIEQFSKRLDYDPETGIFRWKVAPNRAIKAGDEAGYMKTLYDANGGIRGTLRYIRVLGQEVIAARVAWALHNGEWPPARLTYVDGDPSNLRITNIRQQNAVIGKYDHRDPEQRKAYLKEHRATYPVEWRNSHLRKNFGITVEQYDAMAEAQGYKCAICGQPESATRLGKTKQLAVDHHHGSGKVRGLLCVDCNISIGRFKDDAEILEAAAAYIRKHA